MAKAGGGAETLFSLSHPWQSVCNIHDVVTYSGTAKATANEVPYSRIQRTAWAMSRTHGHMTVKSNILTTKITYFYMSLQKLLEEQAIVLTE